MEFPRLNNAFAGLISLTLGLGLIIWLIFDGREARLRQAQSHFLEENQSAWSQEDEKRAIKAREKLLETQRAAAGETLKAFGGEMGAATKDPALDIRQMLEHLARACAPANAAVSVTVDQFTEFDVAVVLHAQLPLPELGAITKRILTSAGPYVGSIRFIEGDEVLAELDGPAIESVTNWSAASADSVQALLLATEVPSQPGSPGDRAEAKAAPSNTADFSPDQQTINEAQNTYNKHLGAHAQALKDLGADLYRAALLDSVHSQGQLQSRISGLDQLAERLAVEREFFMNPAADMEHLLNGKGLDPLIITIVTRGIREREADCSAVMAKYFGDNSAYLDQIRTFLTTMQNHWGKWTVDRDNHVLTFTTSDAHDAYTLGLVSINLSAQLVYDDFQEWAARRAAK